MWCPHFWYLAEYIKSLMRSLGKDLRKESWLSYTSEEHHPPEAPTLSHFLLCRSIRWWLPTICWLIYFSQWMDEWSQGSILFLSCPHLLLIHLSCMLPTHLMYRGTHLLTCLDLVQVAHLRKGKLAQMHSPCPNPAQHINVQEMYRSFQKAGLELVPAKFKMKAQHSFDHICPVLHMECSCIL